MTVLYFILYILSLIYLTLHLECFVVEQICFSFLKIHFVDIDIFRVCWVSVCHICLVLCSFNFLVRVFSIFLSHSYRVLDCFLLLAFQSRFFSIPILSLLVYAENALWKNCSNSSRDIVKQASNWLILLQLCCFCCSNFFLRWSNMFFISSMAKNNFLWLFISFISKVNVLAFSNIVVDKNQLCSNI